MDTTLRRPARALGLYGSIFLLALPCCAQLLNDRHVDPSGHIPRPALASVEKDPNSPSSVRLPLKPSLPASTQLLQGLTFFERNDGQTDSQVLYLGRGSGYSLFLTRTGATIVLPGLRKKGTAATTEPRYLRLRFEKANPQAEVSGIEPLPGTSNYFSGSDSKLWHTRVPQFAKVRYSNLYPGIDLIFYFRDGQIEYDVIASRGADARAVSLRIEGANPSLTREGDVAIRIGAKEVVRLRKPYAYQNGDDGDDAAVVPSSYSLHNGRLSLALGEYDRRRRLVIDPALIFATYITSNCSACIDSISDIAADNTGVYLTGSTTAANFPATATGPTPTSAQNVQTFIVKLDPTGSRVLYSSLLSSSAGLSIAVDSLGSAYVSGSAYVPATSGIPAFPLTTGVFSGTVASSAAGPVAYAAKLSPDGSTILYATLLQQPIPNGGRVASNIPLITTAKIAVDSTAALYVTGTEAFYSSNDLRTDSTWLPLSVTIGAFQATPGSAFVLKLNPNASGLDYATYIDGPGAQPSNFVAGIAVDATGDAFVAGSTSSPTFPTTTGAYETSISSPNGFDTSFVMKLNPTGTAPVYSTFFGTSSQTFGMAVDSDGQAVITGSSGDYLPVTPNAFCGNPTNASAGFVVKFTADGSGLVYATTLCDSFSRGAAVAVDSSGAAVAVGVGLSGTSTAFQSALLDPIQGYVPSPPGPANIAVKLDTSGNLVWSTFFGNNSSGIVEPGVPFPRAAVDGNGAAYILDTSTILPTPNSVGPSVFIPGAGGPNTEALNFLLKIAPSLGAPVPIVSPRQLSFTNQNVGSSSAAADVQVGNFGDAPTSLGVAITGDFSETDNCSVAVPGGQKCDINVVFMPTVTGARTGTLTVSFGGSIPSQTISLTGNAGAPAVSLSPTALSFGDQATGTTSAAQQLSVTNSGTGPLILSSIQTSNQFAATNTCGASVAPAGSCTIQVTFTPSASGTQTGTLTITDNASDSPQIVALAGNVAIQTQPGIGLGVASGGSASATVTAGATATYGLSIGGSGMTGSASLTCTGAPTAAVCSVPATVPLNATSPSTFNASVTTTSRSAVAFYHRGLAPWLWALAIFVCLSFFTIAPAKRTPLSRLRFAPLLVLGVAICSCSGASSPGPTTNQNGTPVGTYTIVVTAKSGITTQTQNLTLTVQ
jgi:hypothetical protein